MTSPEQLAGKFMRAADGIKFSQRDGVNDASKVFQFAVNTNVRAAIGSEMELSGVKFGSKRRFNTARPEPSKKIEAKLLTASSDVKPTAIVKGMPAGMFTIVESGAEKHTVGGRLAERNAFDIRTREAVAVRVTKKRQRESRVKDKRKLMSTGEWAAYGPFMAGGSRGKRPFATAYKSVAPRVAELVQRKTSAALVKAFR